LEKIGKELKIIEIRKRNIRNNPRKG